MIVNFAVPSSSWAAGKGNGDAPGETPANVEAALGFLTSRQDQSGLVDSFVEDNADIAYTYDNAMAVMAFISAGDLAAAAVILDAYAAIGAEPDGGFLHRYRASDGGPADGIPGVGHNAYLLQAMTLYGLESRNTAYDALSLGIADFLLTHQDLDGGLFGRAGATWKSSENNLAAYAAVHNLGTFLGHQDFIDRAQSIRGFLVAECWNGTRFLTGENDPMIVTDAQALGVMVLGPAHENGAYWVEAHTLTTQRYYRGRRVTGFDLNANGDTVWTEGTLQQALAFLAVGDLERAQIYRQEAEKLFLSTGAFWQASNTGSTGFGNSFTRWQAVAPTAWYVVVANQDNVMEPLP
jgi:hypothetical protein